MYSSTVIDPTLMGKNRHPLVHGPGGIAEMMPKLGMKYQMDMVRRMIRHPYYRGRYNNEKSLAICVHRILYGKANMSRAEVQRDIIIMAECCSLLPYGTIEGNAQSVGLVREIHH